MTHRRLLIAGLAASAILPRVAGAQAWNQWRMKHADIEHDLSEADLSKANLRRAHLTQAKLREADLSGANLLRAKVSDEQLALAKSLKGATMPDGSKHP